MKKSPYANLRRVILFSMIVVPLSTLVLILWTGFYYFTASLENSTIATVKRIVEDHRQMIDSFLYERKANLEFVLNSYSFEELASQKELGTILRRLQVESSAFVDLGIFDKSGIHVSYQGPYSLSGRDYGKESWFTEVMKKGQYISNVFLGYRRIPHFIIALKKTAGKEDWVIRATIDTHIFSDLVKSVRIGKTGEAYLLDAKGVFQTERRSGGNLMENDPDILKESGVHPGIHTFIEKDTRGDQYLYATTWLREKDWLLVVRQEKSDAFQSLHSAIYLIVLITLIGSAAIVGIAFYLRERIIRRMEHMDTERDALSGQLIRASRLAELGEMATGFAHEINNPLQVMKSEQALIQTILSDLQEKGELKPSESLSELVDSIRQIDLQIDRCAGITQSILKFGRRSDPVFQDVDLQSFIPEITNMIARNASVHGIALKVDIAAETPAVHGDPGQLQQVLLNLYNNAIDAIITRHGPEGGSLEVVAGPEENGNVKIVVKDNGTGISFEDMQKIFTPFFTTKPVGKGTGLGLSVCYGIVESMGGKMEVESKKGVGTTFTLTFPDSR